MGVDRRAIAVQAERHDCEIAIELFARREPLVAKPDLRTQHRSRGLNIGELGIEYRELCGGKKFIEDQGGSWKESTADDRDPANGRQQWQQGLEGLPVFSQHKS